MQFVYNAYKTLENLLFGQVKITAEKTLVLCAKHDIKNGEEITQSYVVTCLPHEDGACIYMYIHSTHSTYIQI